MITTVTLNPALDKTITVDNLEYGSVNRDDRSELDTGGKGINVSKVLGKLGTKNTAIGFIGKRNKEVFNELLNKEIMDKEFVEIDDITRTNTILVELEKGITTNINEEGFTIEQAQYLELKELIGKYAEKSEFMVFSGSIPKGLNEKTYYELILAVNAQCKTVLDADGALLMEGLKASPYMIKPNIHELENAFNVEINTDQEVIAICRKIINEYKVQVVLISMGGDGCILVTSEEALKALPIPVEVLSTVGAGDSMVAGFIHGLQQHMSYEECLAYGTVCGAMAVSREGVGSFTQEELPELLAKVHVEKL